MCMCIYVLNENLIFEISKLTEWGDSINMLALSIVINRPFCHINAYDNVKKSNESIPGIICNIKNNQTITST